MERNNYIIVFKCMILKKYVYIIFDNNLYHCMRWWLNGKCFGLWMKR